MRYFKGLVSKEPKNNKMFKNCYLSDNRVLTLFLSKKDDYSQIT